jgi:hypothetical protein
VFSLLVEAAAHVVVEALELGVDGVANLLGVEDARDAGIGLKKRFVLRTS